jgi:hypothetical protein
MRLIRFLFIFLQSLVLLSFAQQADNRPIVGVTKFSSEIETKYAGAITEKVVEMLTKSKRFQVVDRTSLDKVNEELKLQRSEGFIDSKQTSQQDALVGANYIVTGHIRQINVAEKLNIDGSIGGYKSSLSFTIKIDETSTGISNESQSFESKGADMALSPERAVDNAIRTLEPQLKEYFAHNFPVNTRILKILTTKKDAATTILIAGGKAFGLQEGDKLSVQKVEIIEGKPYPTDIGEIKVTKNAGDDFSECAVKKGGEEILSRFNSTEKLNCKLLQE